MNTSSNTVASDALAAMHRVADTVERTPLERDSALSDELGVEVYLKLENQQITGSFKFRGATHRLLTLTDEARAAGCVAASSGNHGAAVGTAMQALGVSGVIFVPQQTSPVKVEKIRATGTAVEFFGTDGLDTEQHARQYADEHDMTYLSPYNDPDVIAGQGTCGVEIAAQLPGVDAVFVAVGGGGLIGGVGAVLKQHNPKVRVIGCQPANSPVMAESIRAGEILDMPSEETLSDGTAGGIEANAITFPLAQTVVDEFHCVSEAEIAAEMRGFLDRRGVAIEGAAAVALAVLRQQKDAFQGENVVVIICGGNVSDEVIDKIR
ncbi:MAG: threonine/serine dehydratase [Pseudomonadota bacterium]